MRLAIYRDTKKFLSTRIVVYIAIFLFYFFCLFVCLRNIVHIAIDGEENNDKTFEASREKSKDPFYGYEHKVEMDFDVAPIYEKCNTPTQLYS